MPIVPPGPVLAAVVTLQVLFLLGHLIVARPQRGVLLLALLTPFDGLLLLVPHPPLVAGWKEALLLITLIAAVVAPPQARGPQRDMPPWVAPLLGFAAVCAVSALFVQGTQALIGLKINLFYTLIIPVLYLCPLSWRERDRLVSILMGVGVITAVYGLLQQVVGGAVLNSIGYEYNETIRTAGGLLRSFSTFNQPFPFGFYLMLVLLVCLPVALSDRSRLRNALFLVTVPVLVAGLLSSIVRAAMVGLAVGLVFLWWHRFRLLGHLAAPALVFLILLPPKVFGTFLSSTSLGQRSTGWSDTVDRVLAAPFGNGIGTTGSAAERTAALRGGTERLYQPDNYYFKTVYELGPLGLWMLVLLLVSSFLFALAVSRGLHAVALAHALDEVGQVEQHRGSGRPAPVADEAGRQMRQDASLAAGIAATLLAGAAASVFATYLEIFPIDLHFWLFLGVLTSLAPGSSSEPSPSAPREAVSRPTSAS